MNPPNPFFHKLTFICLVSLIILLLGWELIFTPIVSNSWWPVLVASVKVIPLLIPIKGIWNKKIYTMQWLSMLILFYFIEGVVRSMSDINTLSRALAGAETALSVLLFFSAILYVRPFKKLAKAAKLSPTSTSE